jgi:hypothetical protein
MLRGWGLGAEKKQGKKIRIRIREEFSFSPCSFLWRRVYPKVSGLAAGSENYK